MLVGAFNIVIIDISYTNGISYAIGKDTSPTGTYGGSRMVSALYVPTLIGIATLMGPW